MGRTLVETLEDGLQLVLVDTLSTVLDGDDGIAGGLAEGNLNLATGRGKLEGIR